MITCYFENNDKVHLRHVVINTIIVKDNKILLEKRGTYNGKPILENGKWGLVGGFLDRDETLIEGAKREAREETGWEIDNLQLLRINDSPHRRMEDRQNIAAIFIAKATKRIPTSSEEVTSLKWFSLDELPPKEQIAFDHADALDLYIKYLKMKFSIPVLG